MAAGTRADLAKRYGDLDTTKQQQVTALLDRNGAEGARFASDLDAETLGNFISCSGASVSSLSTGPSAPVTASQFTGVGGPSLLTSTCPDPDFLDQVIAENKPGRGRCLPACVLRG